MRLAVCAPLKSRSRLTATARKGTDLLTAVLARAQGPPKEVGDQGPIRRPRRRARCWPFGASDALAFIVVVIWCSWRRRMDCCCSGSDYAVYASRILRRWSAVGRKAASFFESSRSTTSAIQTRPISCSITKWEKTSHKCSDIPSHEAFGTS